MSQFGTADLQYVVAGAIPAVAGVGQMRETTLKRRFEQRCVCDQYFKHH
jgi:hypothetical protein